MTDISSNIELKNYEIIKEVSEGLTSQVYQVKSKLDDKIYILKKICRTGNKLLSDLRINYVVRNEKYILSRLDHPGIVKLHEFWEDEINYYFILEDCGVDTFEMRKEITEKEAIDYLKQLTDILIYLDQKQIIHHDIKPENILLNNGKITLIDFGFSIIGKESESETGTPNWRAPEIENMKVFSQKLTNKIDIYSLGKTIYSLILRIVPETKNYKIVFYSNVTLSEKFKVLIRAMTHYYPKHRADIYKVKEILD
jgi:serine/threonine protein kinase